MLSAYFSTHNLYICIQIQGEAYRGEREISFQYEFECNIFGPPVKDETVSLLLRGVGEFINFMHMLL